MKQTRKAPDVRQRCVLIVDDDPNFARHASDTLQRAGFAAPVADGERSALALVASMRPDLVLLAVESPDSRGFDLMARLRAAPGAADFPSSS